METTVLVLVVLIALCYVATLIMNYFMNTKTLNDLSSQTKTLQESADKLYDNIQDIKSDVQEIKTNTQKLLNSASDDDDNVAICTK